ncbi:flagellin N-terminal helical domain-containing protein [Cryobacterium zhongshanensis]|uniref:Flagellin n=1 Tax=Cryobacterium zhongshanensis TaxID=2928153 RepID=A0AA41UHQ3_9MICO|nr:flagellin [Cryobacterium zhongshanensis]MCI4658689.1 flagellin [Cryobacterium zhongshanensis]
MGMQINTNIAANNTYRNLTATQNDMSKSLEKLSSGLRINRASDDAAGLTVSEALKSQVGGLTVASRNAQDGISVVQTAEGSLSEVQSILQRVRDLAVQAGNDSNNADSRVAIKTEVTALTKELTRISDSTNFNGTKLLAGGADLSFQVGANSDASSQITVKLDSANVNTVVNALGGKDAAGAALTGAVQNKGFTVATGTATTVTIAQTAGKTPTAIVIASTDDNAAVLAKLQAGVGTDFTVTADATKAGQYNVVSKDATLTDTTANLIAVSGTGVVNGQVSSTADKALDFSTAAGAAAAIAVIDKQLATVSTARANLGASQNRFESVVKTLAVSTENLTAAGSRIRDTDMAAEMVKYTRSSILVQAGTAMLAQANQGNQGVLKLLQ